MAKINFFHEFCEFCTKKCVTRFSLVIHTKQEQVKDLHIPRGVEKNPCLAWLDVGISEFSFGTNVWFTLGSSWFRGIYSTASGCRLFFGRPADFQAVPSVCF